MLSVPNAMRSSFPTVPAARNNLQTCLRGRTELCARGSFLYSVRIRRHKAQRLCPDGLGKVWKNIENRSFYPERVAFPGERRYNLKYKMEIYTEMRLSPLSKVFPDFVKIYGDLRLCKRNFIL